MRVLTHSLFGICFVALLACGCSHGTAPLPTKQSAVVLTEDGGPFAQEVLEVAREYQDLICVTVDWNLAPELCTTPPRSLFIKRSNADENSPHGRKLYHLWVRDFESYERRPDKSQPPYQALVKESFEAIPSTSDFTLNERGEYVASQFKPGARKELFVMMKMSATTPRTDEGWVYGVVAPDLSRTLHSGRIASCMECHTKRPNRIFGLKTQ